jgi:peptidyl-prolyl cis-trans isomerase B (cyclophilin B)
MKKLLLTLLSVCLLTAAWAGKKKTNPNTVVIETEYGNITLVLFDNTPKHRDNFLKLANEGFFDSTLFHRVIPQFMIQGGDPDSKKAAPGTPLGNGDVGYRIDAEINDTNFHQYGAVAAARDNNPNKSSSGCQFYIVVGKKFTGEQLDGMSKQNGRNYTPAQREVYKTIGGTPHLDGNYTVFGQVIEGMDVVEKIVAEPRNNMDRPNKDMRMLKVYVPKVKKKKFLGIF